jgi:triacylglycerol lipase
MRPAGRFCRAISLCIALLPLAGVQADCVVLLHGLARTAGSMAPMAEFLEASGFATANTGYPSRQLPVEALATRAIQDGLRGCEVEEARRGTKKGRVHFVTHSLGGILLRQYLSSATIPPLGRVVMLGPPNQGSEVVDELRHVPGFKLINGPAGQQLGTGYDSLPLRLGPVSFPLGVIAGTRSLNPILSAVLPGPDDGKVTVRSARVSGMCAFLEVNATHTFMMRDKVVLAQTLQFLQEGRFAGGTRCPRVAPLTEARADE